MRQRTVSDLVFFTIFHTSKECALLLYGCSFGSRALCRRHDRTTKVRNYYICILFHCYFAHRNLEMRLGRYRRKIWLSCGSYWGGCLSTTYLAGASVGNRSQNRCVKKLLLVFLLVSALEPTGSYLLWHITLHRGALLLTGVSISHGSSSNRNTLRKYRYLLDVSWSSILRIAGFSANESLGWQLEFWLSTVWLKTSDKLGGVVVLALHVLELFFKVEEGLGRRNKVILGLEILWGWSLFQWSFK